MFKNKIFIFIILVTALLSIGIASAEDSSTLNTTESCDELNEEVISLDNLQSEEEVIKESNSKSFSELQTKINDKSDNSVLVLDDDYKYSGSGDFDGITINKNNFTIDGQGYTIDGDNQVCMFNVRGSNVTLKNLILINANFSNGGGGVIYNTGSHISINNCTFINNTAYYGGAIFANAGTSVEIKNSKFISNTTTGHGGAIAIEKNSPASITDTTFKDCQSIDDAGGAVYAISTDLEVKNSNFINCSANFAGAICSLKSELLVTNTSFTNNSARYEGGAIIKRMVLKLFQTLILLKIQH